jgi:DNA-binding CsgD family transcriptional regulator
MHSSLSENSKYCNVFHKGKSNKSICDSLGITLNTVKTHLKNIYTKMDVASRKEALAKIRSFKNNG